MRSSTNPLLLAPLLAAVVELSGCMTPAPSAPQAPTAALEPAAPTPGAMHPLPSSTTTAPIAEAPPPAAPAPASPPPAQPAAVAPKRPATSTASARGSASKPAPAVTLPASKPAAPAAPPSAPAVASTPPPATLNLSDLEQRLRDTKAIGVFTKLSLKNQVDDLLDEFRSLYKGAAKRPPAELRQRYDQLLATVLDLLKSGDPKLANAIASSREAIWGILADPDKFANI